MAKRNQSSYIKLPEAMKKRIDHAARKNLRTFNEQAILFIAMGIHATEFTVEPYTEEGRRDENA